MARRGRAVVEEEEEVWVSSYRVFGLVADKKFNLSNA